MKNILSEINKEAMANPLGLIERAERDYLKEIESIAKKIADDDDIKIVSIAGPSASGKTTTAHILCDTLESLGETTNVVSLDNFYLPVDKLPILEDGTRDIESVNSLDKQLIEKCFTQIVETGKTVLPMFDFTKKVRIENALPIDISKHGIIIVEGLHGLNPIITDLAPEKNIFKIYISVNSSICDENGKMLMSSRQIRLVRRTLRDMVFRASPADVTLSLWNNVVEGEKKHLYCFKGTADVQLKTLHLYEPCVYRNDFLKLKDQVSYGTPCYDYFMKTADVLEKFESIDSSLVPYDSLIREFIGGGRYN